MCVCVYVQSADRLLVVVDRYGSILSRTWCIWEIWLASLSERFDKVTTRHTCKQRPSHTACLSLPLNVHYSTISEYNTCVFLPVHTHTHTDRGPVYQLGVGGPVTRVPDI